nr:hypothetical protein [Planosporangium flavigriseum]
MRFVLSIILACGALAGCAGSGTTTPANESGGPSVTNSSAQPNPSASGQGPSVTPPGGKPTPTLPGDAGANSSGAMTLTGTITPGVEANCLLLDGYLLVGGPREQLRSGTRVTVTGRVQKDLMTTCQQGTPFVVETAKPA